MNAPEIVKRVESTGTDLGSNYLQMCQQTTQVAASKERVNWSLPRNAIVVAVAFGLRADL